MKVLLVDEARRDKYIETNITDDAEIFYCFYLLYPLPYAITNSHYISGNYIDIIRKYKKEGNSFDYVVIAPDSNCECVFDCRKNEIILNAENIDVIKTFYPGIFNYMLHHEYYDIISHIE